MGRSGRPSFRTRMAMRARTHAPTTITTVTDAGRGPGHGRLLVWQIIETAGFEAAWLTLDGIALHASGQAAGQLPEPYWLTYELDTDHRAVTTHLKVTATAAGTQRHLELSRHDGTWTVNGQARPDLAGALDCDIACSPVTNTMPIIRHGLQHAPGAERFIMAFVQVPDLRVVASRQAYTHLGLEAGAARVRYASGSFASELTVDADGLVIDYPTMAHRIPAQTTVTARQRSSGPGTPRPGSGQHTAEAEWLAAEACSRVHHGSDSLRCPAPGLAGVSS